jgi:hypothetical protein
VAVRPAILSRVNLLTISLLATGPAAQNGGGLEVPALLTRLPRGVGFAQ